METLTLEFSGGDAAEGRLDLYDASISNYGLARTLAILGHYYQTGNIIAHAPRSEVRIYIYPPEEGSFKQTVAAGILGAVIAAPFTIFIQRVIDDWVPDPDPQMQQVIELLQDQNRLLRAQQGMPEEPSKEEIEANERMSAIIEDRTPEFQVLRSITANSFKDIFRPIGRSADYVSIAAGRTNAPVTAIDPRAVALIESERRDLNVHQIVGVVNSFSRSSKKGIVFSRDMGRGFQFQDINTGKLPPQDDYSWSQYYRLPIEMTGTFVYWFDGRVKRFLVEESRRLPED